MKRVINGKTYSKVLGIKQGSLLTAGKDGDIEEYKADVADAGKVLTVGEDGGIAPAEGSVKLYRHSVLISETARNDIKEEWYGITFITSESKSFSIDESESLYNKIAAFNDMLTTVSKGQPYVCPCVGGRMYTDDAEDIILNAQINPVAIGIFLINVNGKPNSIAIDVNYLKSISDSVVEL